jgi:Protein of unknown function (DUF2878)
MNRVAIWANFLGYQIAWVIVVSAAGRGFPGMALVPEAAFIAWQLLASDRRKADLQLMLAALICGVLIDGSLSFLGWLHYAAGAPAVPPGGAPLWILGLWMCFSLTMPRSLAWLKGRLALSILLGAIGAPLAYWSAARGWAAVQFSAPAAKGLTGLAVGWAAAVPVLLSRADSGLSRKG